MMRGCRIQVGELGLLGSVVAKGAQEQSLAVATNAFMVELGVHQEAQSA